MPFVDDGTVQLQAGGSVVIGFPAIQAEFEHSYRLACLRGAHLLLALQHLLRALQQRAHPPPVQLVRRLRLLRSHAAGAVSVDNSCVYVLLLPRRLRLRAAGTALHHRFMRRTPGAWKADAGCHFELKAAVEGPSSAPAARW